MIINLIDPSMKEQGTHLSQQNKAFSQELIALGHEVNLITLQGVAPIINDLPNFRQLPLFSIYPYKLSKAYHDIPADHRLTTYFELCASVYGQAYEGLPQADINYFPYAWHFMVYAWGIFSKSHTFSATRVFFSPNGAPDIQHELDPLLWRRAFAAVEGLAPKIRFGVHNQELSVFYEALFSNELFRMETTPLPLECAPTDRKYKLTTVGMAGCFVDSKKGHKFIMKYVKTLTSLGIKVLIHDSSGRLHQLASLPNVEVLGYVDDMAQVFHRVDALLLPYEPGAYQNHTSGICMECMSAGVPVLLPLGTCNSRYVAKYGSGEHYVAGDAQSLARAVQRMAAAFPEFSARSQEGAKRFMHDHGYGKHIQWLLGD